jgi:hypothetical protein
VTTKATPKKVQSYCELFQEQFSLGTPAMLNAIESGVYRVAFKSSVSQSRPSGNRSMELRDMPLLLAVHARLFATSIWGGADAHRKDTGAKRQAMAEREPQFNCAGAVMMPTVIA